MQHPDEGTIHAWLDGALPDDERTEVEQHVASCAECAASAAEARGVIAGASRIVIALDLTPGGVIPKSTAASAVTAQASETSQSLSLWRLLRITPARAALAASLLVAASLLLTKRHDTPNKLVPHPLAAVATVDSTIAAPVRAGSAGGVRVPMAAPAAKRVAKAAQPAHSDSRDTTVVPVSAQAVASAASPAPAAPVMLPVPTAAAPLSAPSKALDAEPRSRLGFSVARMSEVAADRAASPASRFVGCYQIEPASPDLGSLPLRFALQLPAESGNGSRNVVRAVTADGRIDSVLAGSSWRSATPTLSDVSFASPDGIQRLDIELAAGGSLVASMVSDTTARRIPISRTSCRP